MIEFKPGALKVSMKLLKCIRKVIQEGGNTEGFTSIVINFRDSSYSSERGGYHPVEISLQECSTDKWVFSYITDFGYHGHPYPELIKELDFDFSTGLFISAYLPPYPINHPSVKDMFKTWQQNFVDYVEFDAFDQIDVSGY